jgi:hypothetical protein
MDHIVPPAMKAEAAMTRPNGMLVFGSRSPWLAATTVFIKPSPSIVQ